MRHTLRALFALAIIFPLGCDRLRGGDPGIDIRVTREQTGYTFSFRTCRGGKIGVPWVNVTEGVGRPEGAPVHCEIAAISPSVRRLEGPWRYGAVPRDYQMSRCEPLRSRQVYEVQATGAAGGRRIFFIRPDGSVELREGTCDERSSRDRH